MTEIEALKEKLLKLYLKAMYFFGKKKRKRLC